MSFNIDSSSESEKNCNSDSEVNNCVRKIINCTMSVDIANFNEEFEYPFRWINSGEYLLKDMLENIPNSFCEIDKIKISLKNTFNKRIKNVFWCKKGFVNKNSWEAIGVIKFKTKKYFFYYNAKSRYGGFDVHWDMSLYIYKNIKELFELCVPERTINFINKSIF